MTIILFFIVLSVLILIHEFGHFIAAKRAGVYVEEFGLGLPPRAFGVKIGETLYSLNFLPFGGFVKVLGEEAHELEKKKLPASLVARTFVKKKHWQKALIISAGVFFNFLLGWVIISYLFTQGIPTPTEVVRIEEIAAGSPAEQVGLKKGDIIDKIALADKSVTIRSPSDLIDATKQFSGQEVVLTIIRDSAPLTVSIVPRTNPPKEEGALGIAITNIEIKRFPVWQAPILGLAEAANITFITARELLRTLGRVVTFQKVDIEVAGPVGIANLTSEAASYGINALLQLVGILSLNLAVINILPFPSLDGGRLVLVMYEWGTGRRVNPKFERRLNIAGFAALLSLIILITVNDIMKLL